MSVFKKNDKWYLYVTYNGIRYRKKTNVKTKTEALLVEAEFRRKLELEGTGLYTRNINVNDLIAQYLSFKKEQRSPKTYQRDSGILRNFLRHVNPKTAMDIIPALMDMYISRRSKDSYKGRIISKRTINIEITAIKAMLNWAEKRKLIRYNPVKNCEKLRVPNNITLKFLSLEQVQKLLAKLSPMMYPIILTFLKTGIRRNELVNLKWEDIDFSNKQIAIKGEDRATGHHSKTYQERHVPIDSELVQVLKKHYEKTPFNKANNYVFCTYAGNIRKNNLLNELKRQAKSIGIDYITIHMLRHTYASLLRMNGADLGAVGKLLGHRELRTTQIYEHLSPDFLRKTADLLPIKIQSEQDRKGR